METINNIRTAATKAIWGDDQAHQEPVSGKTGDVSKGEPYDAGNIEPEDQTAKTADAAVDETGTQPVESGVSQPAETKKTTTTTTATDDIPSVNPTKVMSSSVQPGDSTKAQNDVRDPTNPDAQHHNASAKDNVDDTGSGLDVGDNPEKLDGPGPKPIAEVAKEHGGDAGNLKSGSDSSNSGLADSHPLGRHDSGHDSGTGELYVKSSGLRAEGGDFDAAAPGAGREADRLLDQKGVHHGGPNGGIVADSTTKTANGHANGSANGKIIGDGSPTKEKTSLKDKIKAKLHRNSATSSS